MAPWDGARAPLAQLLEEQDEAGSPCYPRPMALNAASARFGCALLFACSAATSGLGCSGHVRTIDESPSRDASTADTFSPADALDDVVDAAADGGPDVAADGPSDAAPEAAPDVASDIEQDTMPPPCLEGERRCDGNTPWHCDAMSQWQPGSPCVWPTSACLDGVCAVEPLCTESGWCWDNPRPFGGTVRTLWGSTPDDVWAGSDRGRLFHWDGARWVAMGAPKPFKVMGISGLDADDVFAVAVGTWSPHGSTPALLHYDGSAWSLVSDEGSAGTFADLWVVSATEIWAAVTRVGQPPLSWCEVHRWDGSTWSVVDGDSHCTLGGTAPDDIWAVGGKPDASHWDGAAWSEVSAGTDEELYDIWGPSHAEVWAVGGSGTVLRWDGAAWLPFASPSSQYLFAVHGTSSSDIWVLAFDYQVLTYEVWHWDGFAWSGTELDEQPNTLWASTPTDAWIAGDTFYHFDGATWSGGRSSVTSERLADVWVNGPDDVWAVGPLKMDGSSFGQSDSDCLLHWDGSSWTRVASGSEQYLSAVWGAAANDVWAVGPEGVVLYWDGLAWSPVASGVDADLSEVWGSSPNDVWVIGYGDDGGVILHGDASGLVVQSTVPEGLHAIWGSGPSDVWIVGEAGTILHWDGGAWASFDSATANQLEGVFGLAADDVWAVGVAGTTVHWDGLAWSSVEAVTAMTLRSIWGAGPDDLWAVGPASSEGIPGFWDPIMGVIHWDGASWSVVDDVGGTQLHGVAGLPSGEAWAVGYKGTILHRAP